MKHEKKVLRVFSKKNKGGKKQTIQTQCWDKSHAFISNQMRYEEKTPTKSNPVSAEMDVYSKTGGISPAHLLSIINDLQ